MVNNIQKAKLKPSCTGFIPSMFGNFWVSPSWFVWYCECVYIHIFKAIAVATVMVIYCQPGCGPWGNVIQGHSCPRSKYPATVPLQLEIITTLPSYLLWKWVWLPKPCQKSVLKPWGCSTLPVQLLIITAPNNHSACCCKYIGVTYPSHSPRIITSQSSDSFVYNAHM